MFRGSPKPIRYTQLISNRPYKCLPTARFISRCCSKHQYDKRTVFVNCRLLHCCVQHTVLDRPQHTVLYRSQHTKTHPAVCAVQSTVMQFAYFYITKPVTNTKALSFV